MDHKALVNRGDDPYPNDVKAEAVALVYESGNFSEAARTMAQRYPERPPARQLITRWFHQVDSEAFAALGTERKEAFRISVMEMGAKAVGKLFDALDDMSPQQIPIPAGIAIDKALRLLETEGRGSFNARGENITINFIAQDDPRKKDDPDTIDGEIVSPDGDGGPVEQAGR